MRKQFAGIVGAAVLLISCATTAEQYIVRGKAHLEAGRPDDAAIQFQKAIQKNSGSAEAHFQLGVTEARRQNARNALASLSRASQLAPEREDIRVQLADFALTALRSEPSRPPVLYETVRQQADNLLEKDPNSYHGLRFRAHIAAIDRKVDEAVTLFRKVQAQKPLEPDTAMPLVGGLVASGKAGEAEQLALAVLAKHPKTAEAYDFLYFRYRAAGRLQDAERLLRAKVDNIPGNTGYVLQLAAHYARDGKQPEATREVQRLLNDARTYPDAALQVGEFYAGIGKPDEALVVLREGLGKTSDTSRKPEYQRQIAGILAGQGKRDESLQMLTELKRAGTATNDTLRFRATLLLASGKESDARLAIEDLQTIIKQTPQDVSARMQLAQAWVTVQDLRKAQGELTTVVQARKDLIEPRLALGEVYRRQGDYKGTLQYSDEALAIDPSQPGARLMRAVGLTGLGRLDEAETEVQRVLRAAPAYADARLHLAFIQLGRRKPGEAEKGFRNLYTPGAADLRPLEGLTASLVAQNRAGQAMQVVADELKNRPDSIGLRLLMARTAASVRQPAAAEHYTWLATQSNSADVLLEAGAFEHSQSRAAEAAQRYQRARQLASADDFRPSLALASLYHENGQRKEALANYRQAAAIAPNNPVILNDLAFCLSESADNLDEALQFAIKARAAAPKMMQIADTLAWIYVKKNQPDAAIQILSTLTKDDNSKAVYHYHLGAALLRKGDVAGAKRHLQIALARNPSKTDEEAVRQLLSKQP